MILARTGEGCTRAEQGADLLLDRFDPKLLVVVGIAGGLSPDLEAGDIVVVFDDTKLNIDNSYHDPTGLLTAPDTEGNWPLREKGRGVGFR